MQITVNGNGHTIDGHSVSYDSVVAFAGYRLGRDALIKWNANSGKQTGILLPDQLLASLTEGTNFNVTPTGLKEYLSNTGYVGS